MSTFHKERMEICRACEHFRPVWGEKISACGICHCLMELKTRIASMDCPDGRWGPVQEDDVKAP